MQLLPKGLFIKKSHNEEGSGLLFCNIYEITKERGGLIILLSHEGYL